jgi:hypothetical protein
MFKAFKKFYNENKDKLHMPKPVNYPINYKKAKLWADSQCDAESRVFANEIIKYTKHVSYEDFINNIKKACLSYKEAHSRDRHNTEFVLIVPFKLEKSNLWVSLLSFEYLKDVITDVGYDITVLYNSISDSRSKFYNKRVRCIICDDCAYTGHQLEYIASLDSSTIKFDNKEKQPSVYHGEWLHWYKRNIRESKKHIKKVSIDNFSVDIIIPYMSILAEARLLNIHYVRIPKNCVIFPIFTQQTNINNIQTHVLNEFRRTFQFHKDISAIYFDHKIADAVSTFQKVYMLAPQFNCSVSNKRIGFIENCNSEKIPSNINIYDHYMDMGPELGTHACPATHYKSIKYTFNKVPISSDMYIFDLINI